MRIPHCSDLSKGDSPGGIRLFGGKNTYDANEMIKYHHDVPETRARKMTFLGLVELRRENFLALFQVQFGHKI